MAADRGEERLFLVLILVDIDAAPVSLSGFFMASKPLTMTSSEFFILRFSPASGYPLQLVHDYERDDAGAAAEKVDSFGGFCGTLGFLLNPHLFIKGLFLRLSQNPKIDNFIKITESDDKKYKWCFDAIEFI